MRTHRVCSESRFNTQPKLRLPGEAVAPGREDGAMTDEEVIAEAAGDGFELEERPCGDAWVWAGARVTTRGGPATSSTAQQSTGCATG